MRTFLSGIVALLVLVACVCVSTDLFAAEEKARQARTERKQPRVKKPGVSQEVIDQFEAGEFQGIPYRFLEPDNYDPEKKYPFVLSLHGAGGTGTDNLASMRDWTAIFVEPEWRKQYPCFVLIPHSPASWRITGESVPELTDEMIKSYSETWQRRIAEGSERMKRYSSDGKGSLSITVELIEKLGKEYSIDMDRIYVLGHSMGGAGSWTAVCGYPDFFAAAIPSAGALPPWKDWSRFAKVPIWTFHGTADNIVSIEYTRDIFKKMKELGGNVKFTELEGVPHSAHKHGFWYKGDDPEKGYITHYASSSCDKTQDTWEWLFKHKR